MMLLMLRKRLETSVAQMHTLQSLFRRCVEYPLQMEGCRRSEAAWQQTLNEHADHQHLEQETVRLNAVLLGWNEVMTSLRESSRLYELRKGMDIQATELFIGDKAGEQALALEGSIRKNGDN